MVRNYDTTLTDEEVKSNLTLIGLSGGLMIDSDDLTRLSVERQKLGQPAHTGIEQRRTSA